MGLTGSRALLGACSARRTWTAARPRARQTARKTACRAQAIEGKLCVTELLADVLSPLVQAAEFESNVNRVSEWLIIGAIIATAAVFRFWRIDHPDSVVSVDHSAWSLTRTRYRLSFRAYSLAHSVAGLTRCTLESSRPTTSGASSSSMSTLHCQSHWNPAMWLVGRARVAS